jgi:hypothetical protein
MQHSRLGSLIGAGALAAGLGTIILAAPAYALSESTIKSECAAANGTYITQVKQGMRFSACCYKDYTGKKYCDYYADGNYYSTSPQQLETPPAAPPPQSLPPRPGPTNPPTVK